MTITQRPDAAGAGAGSVTGIPMASYYPLVFAHLYATLDVDAAVDVWAKTYRQAPSGQVDTPWTGWTPAIGTWRFNPQWYEFEVLLAFNPSELANNEDDEDGRRICAYDRQRKLVNTVDRYREWALAGHQPPPITVYRSANDPMVLLSQNRRRLLVARDLGMMICGWYSETWDVTKGAPTTWPWQASSEPDPGPLKPLNALRSGIRKRYQYVLATKGYA